MINITKPDSIFPKSTNVVSESVTKKETMFPFYLIVAYLFFEYGRIQTLIPPLRLLHLPAITVAFIAISVLLLGKFNIKNKQVIFFILILIEMILHGPIAVNNYWAFQVFYSMVVTFIAFVGIVNIIDNKFKYNKLIQFWLTVFIFLAIYGYFNADLHLPKARRYGMGVGGFIGDSNDFCMALNMILPFALFSVFSANNKVGKIYYILLSCLFLLVIILSESRGGFIGLVCVAIYCWLRSNKKFILTLMIGMFIVFALIVAPPSYWNEVKSISTENTESNQSGTGAQRIYSWKLGWKMFLKNPAIGVGQGNYPWNVGMTEDELGVSWRTRSLSGRAAHSLYFTLLAELGLIGTILFVLMIIYSIIDLQYIKKILKSRNDIFSKEDANRIYYQTLALEGSLVGYLTSSVFISTLYYPSFWILCGFIISLKNIVSSNTINVIIPENNITKRNKRYL